MADQLVREGHVDFGEVQVDGFGLSEVHNNSELRTKELSVGKEILWICNIHEISKSLWVDIKTITQEVTVSLRQYAKTKKHRPIIPHK